jgi:hypothetical protein
MIINAILLTGADNIIGDVSHVKFALDVDIINVWDLN